MIFSKDAKMNFIKFMRYRSLFRCLIRLENNLSERSNSKVHKICISELSRSTENGSDKSRIRTYF